MHAKASDSSAYAWAVPSAKPASNICADQDC